MASGSSPSKTIAGRTTGSARLTNQPPTLVLVSVPSSAVVGTSVDVKTRLAVGGVGVAGKIVTVAAGGITQIGKTASDGTAPSSSPLRPSPAATDQCLLRRRRQFPAGFRHRLVPDQPGCREPRRIEPCGRDPDGRVGGKTQAFQQEAVNFGDGSSGPLTIFANTDNLGRAALPPAGLPSGNYTVTGASFAGNATFAPANLTFASPQQFNVAKLPKRSRSLHGRYGILQPAARTVREHRRPDCR